MLRLAEGGGKQNGCAGCGSEVWTVRSPLPPSLKKTPPPPSVEAAMSVTTDLYVRHSLPLGQARAAMAAKGVKVCKREAGQEGGRGGRWVRGRGRIVDSVGSGLRLSVCPTGGCARCT